MLALRLCFIGPAESVTFRRWADWFAIRGHDVTLLTVEPAKNEHLGRLKQIDLGRRRGPAKIGRLAAVGRLVASLRRLRPDIVHAHYVRGLAWGLLAARLHPYVLTPWGSDVLEEQGAFRDWSGKYLTSRLLGGADLVTVHSGYLAARVRPLVPARVPMARIGWGVDLRRFRSGLTVENLRARLGISKSTRVIFSPRAAKPFYNHDRILAALPQVLKQYPDTVLIFSEHFPDTTYTANLRRLASSLGVADRVHFIGEVPYSEMPRWYNLADIVVMLPRSDGMPNTLWEAMACGAVPVVANLPQYEEVIHHGVNGFTAQPEPENVAAAIIDALPHPKRAAMRDANRILAAKAADQDQEMRTMEDVYYHLSRGSGEGVLATRDTRNK